MQHDFWHDAWAKSDSPGWQQKSANEFLTAHWDAANLVSGDEIVFVPLCGRSLDMLWLRERGHHVIGVDLSARAIQDFCEQQSIDAVCERDDGMTVFRAPGWTLYAGDFFKLKPAHLSRVSRVYDRAALIALPEPMRVQYAAQLQSILPGGAEIFLITISYDQGKMKGPPFSVPEAEVRELFYRHYDIQVLHRADTEDTGNLARRGLESITDSCYSLQPQVERET